MNPARAVSIQATLIDARPLGRYLIRYKLGGGGVGEVFLAQMRGAANIDRWVALKVLRTDLSDEARFVSMFLDEARILSQLFHPNLCGVVDFGQADGRYYLALEYLHGETLSATVQRLHAEASSGAAMLRPVDLVARIVADAARGLHSAHEAKGADGRALGIVHRDVSPQNLFILYEGVAKVVDFGIAAARGREYRSVAHEFKGKFAYASPEQVSGKPVDRRSDLFALGIVLWEACLGRRLFQAASEAEAVLRVIQGEIPRPSSIDPDFPPIVERVVLRALERDPEKRYQTAEQLADDLEEHLFTLARPMGTSQVAAIMRRLFPDQIAQRDAMLRASIPPPSIPREDSVDTTLSRPSSRRSAVWLALAVLLAAGTGTVAYWSASMGDTPSVPLVRPIAIPPPSAAAPATTLPPFPETAAQGTALEGPSSAELTAPGTAEPATAEPALSEAPSRRRSRPARGTEAPSPAPAETQAPSEAAASPGFLSLMVRPESVRVLEHGRLIGETPLIDAELPAGRHTLRLVGSDGTTLRTVVVHIRSDERTNLSLEL